MMMETEKDSKKKKKMKKEEDEKNGGYGRQNRLTDCSERPPED